MLHQLIITSHRPGLRGIANDTVKHRSSGTFDPRAPSRTMWLNHATAQPSEKGPLPNTALSGQLLLPMLLPLWCRGLQRRGGSGSFAFQGSAALYAEWAWVWPHLFHRCSFISFPFQPRTDEVRLILLTCSTSTFPILTGAKGFTSAPVHFHSNLPALLGHGICWWFVFFGRVTSLPPPAKTICT